MSFFLAKNLPSIYYILSLAATWIWAPALFVSSGKGYNDGIVGLLLFLVPNILTLIIYGKLSTLFPDTGFTLDAFIHTKKQYILHKLISLVVLICSSCVQFLGICLLLETLFNIPRYIICILVSLIALLLVGKKGLKGSIISDFYKYLIMFIGVVYFLYTQDWSGLTTTFLTSQKFILGNSTTPALTQILYFGIPTAIGLLFAPYVDHTFISRTLSIDKNKRFSIYALSGLAFGIIPLCFGLIGILANSNNILNWQLWSLAISTSSTAILLIVVLAALISTLDSNLCALPALLKAKSHKEIFIEMCSLLLIASMICCFSKITIVELFLLYGTIRTVAAIPTILILIKKYNTKRLFICTLLATITCPIGYIAFPSINYIFTILAVLIPLIGFSNKKS